jgi:hypothetical protein
MVSYPLRQSDYYLPRPISQQEIWDQLEKMKGSSCPGTDDISTKALRSGKTTFIPILASVFSLKVEKAC